MGDASVGRSPAEVDPFILLVEDTDADAELALAALRRSSLAGLRVVRVRRLKDAIAQVDANPACVLLDLGLPDSSGLRGVRSIVRRNRRLPVVIVTGNTDTELALEALGCGAQDYVVKGEYSSSTLERAVRHSMARRRMQLAEEAAAHRHLERRANTDALTGLANRAVVLDRLQFVLSQRRRPPLAVVFADLDGFKAVNDRFGHSAGDEVLQEVALRLKGATRRGDVVARLGGDEFLVLAQVESPGGGAALAERLNEAFRQPWLVGGRTLSLGVSLGTIDVGADEEASSASLIERADEAMYQAKRRRRSMPAVGDGRIVVRPIAKATGRAS